MKTLIFIIGFVTIVISSTYFLAPQFRGYHEGRLQSCAMKTLHDAGFADFKNGYMGVDVKMSHLHASEIVITVNKDNEHSEAEIAAQVVELVREIPGAHTDLEYIRVNRVDESMGDSEVLVSRNDQAGEVKSVDLAKESQKQSPTSQEVGKNFVKNMNGKSLEKGIDQTGSYSRKKRVPCELYVEWNYSKNEVNVDGKLSSVEEKNIIIKPLSRAFGVDQVKNSLIVSNKLVNTPAHLAGVASLISKVAKLCRGAGSVKYIDQPRQIEIRGRLNSKDDFAKVEALLASHREKKITIKNALKYFPEFEVKKNDEKRMVILSGYADKNDSVNLSSYVRRYTRQKSNSYTFKSEISPDLRCEEYVWKSSDQNTLDKYLANVVRGTLVFRNDKIAEISGVTANEDYHKRLKEEMLATGVKYSLSYDPEARPAKPKTSEKSIADGSLKSKRSKKLIAQEKEDLKNQLEKFKIYFASGKNVVDAKYNKDLGNIAQIILSSKDKTSQLVIGGYADRSGNAATNEMLSKDRATSVQAKLVALGVSITRTKIEFFGAENNSKEKWRSRRVEIEVR